MLPRSLRYKLIQASIHTAKRQARSSSAAALRGQAATSSHLRSSSSTTITKTTSNARLLHTTTPALYPRWINKKSDGRDEPAVEGEEHQQALSEDETLAEEGDSSSSSQGPSKDGGQVASRSTGESTAATHSSAAAEGGEDSSAPSTSDRSPASASSNDAASSPSPPSASPDNNSQSTSVSGQSRRGSSSSSRGLKGGQSSSSESSTGGSSHGSGSGGAFGGGGSSGSGNGSNSGGGSAPSSSTTSITKPAVPEVYPQVLALPITRRPLFPGFYKAVVVRNPAVVAAIKEMMKRGQPYLGAFLLKDEDADSDIITDVKSIHKIGVFAQITSIFPAQSSGKDEPEGLTAVLYPHRRIKITELIPPRDASSPIHSIIQSAEEDGVLPPAPSSSTAPPSPTPSSEASSTAPSTPSSEASTQSSATSDSSAPPSSPSSSTAAQSYQTSFLQDFAVSLVNVENIKLDNFKKNSSVVKAVTSEIISVFKDIATLNPLFRDQIANFSLQSGAGNVFEEPEKLADFAAAVSTGEIEELQSVLTSTTIEDRLQKALLVLKKELMNAQLQNKISRDVEGKIQKRQREYYLMEQLKGIKKELGLESDGKDKMVEKFKEKAEMLNMPEQVKKVFDEEISKLQHLEPSASEFNVTRNYLDWLTQIPWGRHSEENFSIANAVTVLDEDHYGLKDVKDRILEFLAVGKLRGTVEGKILCFVGPPGVGKTSIGKSIARALNRQFFRFSVGGLTDVAEIKGHRRT